MPAMDLAVRRRGMIAGCMPVLVEARFLIGFFLAPMEQGLDSYKFLMFFRSPGWI
jgi:hypothetical protein